MVNLYLICSLLMAALFIISTSAQFDDPDWYLWIPLYAGAAYVNLMNLIVIGSSKITANVGRITLASGEFIASKVILEHYSGESVSVSASTEFQNDLAKKMKLDVASPTKYGMAILVCIGYGLSAVFLMYHENEMKF